MIKVLLAGIFFIFINFEACSDIEWPLKSRFEMRFKLTFNTELSHEILDTYHFESSDPDFNEFDTITGITPFGHECFDNNCISVTNRFKDYHRLQIIFSDRTITSNNFHPMGVISNYEVVIRDDNLEIRNIHVYGIFNSLPLLYFLVVFLFIIMVKTPFSIIYLRLMGLRGIYVFYIIGANMIALPVIWFSGLNSIATAFGILVFVECLVLAISFRKKMNIIRILLLSLLLNLSSITFGGVIYLYLKFAVL